MRVPISRPRPESDATDYAVADPIVNYDAPPFWLLSAHKSDSDATSNAIMHEELGVALSALGVDYAETHGCWQGRLEKGYIVLDYAGTDDAAETASRTIAGKAVLWQAAFYRQDAVIYVNEARTAYLVEPDYLATGKRRVTELGPFREISRNDAPTTDGYTYFDGRYWRAGQ